MTKYTLFFLLVATAFVCSCKKTVLTGSGLLPKGDNVNGIYMDTLTLLTKTTRENPLYTNANTTFLLGSMRDPVFGNSSASIFTQIAPIEYNPSFGTATIDSVVLCLVYIGKYGDLKTVPQSVNVYQLTNGTLNSDSSYLSNEHFTPNPVKIGSKQNFYPDFTTKPISYSSTDGAWDTLSPMLRIRLSNSFGQGILNDSAAFTTQEDAQIAYPGFLLAPDTTHPGKGLMYFNMADPSTQLVLYYHQNGAPHTFPFILSGGCTKTNFFTHNYINSIAGNALKSTAASDSIVYVQAMAGLRTKITIPYLPSNILINKAEITVTQVLNQSIDDTAFHVPNQMFVLADSVGANGIGVDQLTPDLLTEAPLAYGGLKSVFVNSKGQTVVSYKFSCTDVLQEMVANLKTYPKQKNYQGLYIIPATATDLADRIVLGGGNSKAAKMKLTLIYTKLP